MKHKLTIIGTIYFIAFVLTPNATGQWVRSTGLTSNVYSLAANDSYVFASTSNGVFRSTDNGLSWASAPNSGLTNHYTEPLSVDGPYLLTGTFGDGIFRSSDNGATWEVSAGLKNEIIDGEILVSGKDIFITGESGVFKSADSGTSWFSVHQDAVSFHALAVNGTNIFAINDNGVLLSTDDGTTWNSTAYINASFKHALEASAIDLFAGTSSGIFHSSNNGTSWNLMNKGLTSSDVHCFAINDSHLFAGTANGVFLSTDNGASWIIEGLKGSAYGTINKLIAWKGSLIAACAGGIYRRPLSDFSAVKNSEDQSTTSIVPNPTTSILSISNAPQNLASISILNVLGQEVIQMPSLHSTDFTIDLSKLQPGTYCAKFTSPTGVITRKIIKE